MENILTLLFAIITFVLLNLIGEFLFKKIYFPYLHPKVFKRTSKKCDHICGLDAQAFYTEFICFSEIDYMNIAYYEFCPKCGIKIPKEYIEKIKK